jgi:hypothetical protein
LKKHSAKEQPKVEPAVEVSHLDQTLTALTKSAATGIQKWWKLLALAFGAILIAVVATLIVIEVRESRRVSLNERAYELFDGAAARKDGYTPESAQVDALLADARGDSLEPVLLKAAVDFYLSKADRLEAEESSAKGGASPPLGSATPSAATTPSASGGQTSIEDARAQALRLAEEGLKRFPNDADVAAWAGRVKSKIEGDRSKAWLPPKWKFSPKVPEPGSPAPATPAPEGAGAPPTGAQEKPAPIDGAPAR